MSVGWTYLLLAGAAEIGFVSLLKLTEGFTRAWPTAAFFVCAGLSFWLMTKAVQTLPVGMAYAVWMGIGAGGAVVIGIVFFNDPVTFWRLFFTVLLIGSIIGLKVVS